MQNQAERIELGPDGHWVYQVGRKGVLAKGCGVGEGGGASRTPAPPAQMPQGDTVFL